MNHSSCFRKTDDKVQVFIFPLFVV